METQRYRIKKDDKVKVIAGKDKGKMGKVLKILHKKNRVLVENVNMVKRHSKPSSANRQGGIIDNESAIDISNVALMCSKCLQPGRVKMKLLEDGKKARVCLKCNEMIDT